MQHLPLALQSRPAPDTHHGFRPVPGQQRSCPPTRKGSHTTGSIGQAPSLVAELIADPRVEALQINEGTDATQDADDVNRPQR